MIRISIILLLLTSCTTIRTNKTIENEKKLRYNHIEKKYEYAREDEQLKYNHIEDEYSYE